ncbi:Trm112 family protein [Amycolatopsis acidicola]|uniref:Trm112 family protein n=1 Tax=Amycolatopsis acidicola TaxID=2596893 RepID=A0A5N0UHF4_9PSEU|nr:Trm112 family protein [Amycolatopsis acidicola]KAA9147821.1 Trm112 family protein [Amycolatopsis acidicola]
MTLDRHLLTVLACAIDKHALLYFADDQILYNPRLRRLYRIESGIPMMRADLASPVDEPRHRDLVRRAPAEASATLGESVDAVVSTVD